MQRLELTWQSLLIHRKTQASREQILPAVKTGLCAAVLTQLSDVEDETNGLVTYDRRVVKVEKEAMQNIGKDLQNEVKFSLTRK